MPFTDYEKKSGKPSTYTPKHYPKSRVIKTSVNQVHMADGDFLTRNSKARIVRTTAHP